MLRLRHQGKSLILSLTVILVMMGSGIARAQASSDTLKNVVVIPNPYSVLGRTWGPISNQKAFERIRFANLPNTPCSIHIYTSRGNHVITLNHRGGSQNFLWDGRNLDNQYMSSDVYVYVVDSPTLGKKIGKLIVIR